MSLLDEAIEADLAAIELELERLQPETTAGQPRQQPRRPSANRRLPSRPTLTTFRLDGSECCSVMKGVH
jgi:hypothetical protein